MRPVNLDDLSAVSARLERLDIKFAFTGGAIIGFLLDNPSLLLSRTTNDIDAIVEIVTRVQYTDLEKRLQFEAGFHHDMSEGAPVCRWIVEDVKADIMPMWDPTGQFADRWFEYALKTATKRTLHGVSVYVVSATCFAATKLTAFHDRGNDDYLSSHDLEDFLTVIDGRKGLIDELALERVDLCDFVAGSVADLLGKKAFLEALPGHLPPDDASQARLPLLTERLRQIVLLRKV